MWNRVFQAILDEKIEFFRLSFERTSKEIFLDSLNWRLIHPWEYWEYRENICKDFLRLITPSRLDIWSWFVIGPFGDVSTQCDLIVFDKQNTPLIETSDKQKFYPTETVVAIGEVKSTLTKSDFIITINKLAKNKKIRECLKDPTIIKREHPNKFDPINYPYDATFSFLICKKLDFNIENIWEEINSLYEPEIEPWQKHNLILSIDDWLMCYFDKNWISLMYPYVKWVDFKNRFIYPTDNKNIHFIHFSNCFFMAMSSLSLYFPETTHYIEKWDWWLRKDQL